MDERIRKLERAASQGDPDAAERLEHERRRVAPPKRKTGRPPAGTPTRVNLWVLGQTFGDGADTAPNQFRPSQRPHLMRLLRAGLIEVDAAVVKLTAAGRSALGR